MKRLAALCLIVVSTLVLAWLPPEPAAAASLGNVEFSVSGTLPQFPCIECSVDFSGTGTGAGHAQAIQNGTHYDATFTVLSGGVWGSVSYAEPGLPFCPAFGSAAGSVTLSGGAEGVVRSSATPIPGFVDDVTFTLYFSYVRAGALATIIVTWGSLVVHFNIPGVGRGLFVNTIVGGAGSGVFETNAVDAVSGCFSPRPLAFTVVGDAVVAGV